MSLYLRCGANRTGTRLALEPTQTTSVTLTRSIWTTSNEGRRSTVRSTLARQRWPKQRGIQTASDIKTVLLSSFLHFFVGLARAHHCHCYPQQRNTARPESPNNHNIKRQRSLAGVRARAVSRGRIVLVARRTSVTEAYSAHTISACSVRGSSACSSRCQENAVPRMRVMFFFSTRRWSVSWSVRARGQMWVRGRGRVVASVAIIAQLFWLRCDTIDDSGVSTQRHDDEDKCAK